MNGSITGMHALKFWVCLLFIFGVGQSVAGNEVLDCRLFVHDIDHVDEKTLAPQSVFRLSKITGIAICQDERLAQRQSVFTEHRKDGIIRFNGFSVYTFENGDTFTLKLRGETQGDDTSADLEVVTGSGQYEGANGTGTLIRAPSDFSITQEFDMKIIITAPGIRPSTTD